MKIAIHSSKISFSESWITYCEENLISFKIVDCYKSDIIQQLGDCEALMWHFHQGDPRDLLFAKQLLYSVKASGKKVFPDFNTAWHFDDKVGQKYLLEALDFPLVPSYVFYSKDEALEWLKNTSFPIVFKLRIGSGSQNVRLVRTPQTAKKLIKKAFGWGFPSYNPASSLKERWRKYRLGKTDLKVLIKGVIRFIVPPEFSKVLGRERGYIYFQEFIPDNDHDIRVIVIGNKAFALKRVVRKNDFRASGSGNLKFEKELFSKELIKLAFEISEKIKVQSIAMDIVHRNRQPMLVEISYGFPPKNFIEGCQGYWDKDMTWHEGKFNPYGWMVEDLIRSIDK